MRKGILRPGSWWSWVKTELERVNRVQNWIQAHDHHLSLWFVCFHGQKEKNHKLLVCWNWSFKVTDLNRKGWFSVSQWEGWVPLYSCLVTSSQQVNWFDWSPCCLEQFIKSDPLASCGSCMCFAANCCSARHELLTPLVPMTPLDLIYILASKTQYRHCHFLGVSSTLCLSVLPVSPPFLSPSLSLQCCWLNSGPCMCQVSALPLSTIHVITQNAFLLQSRSVPTPSASVRALKHPVCKLAK